jgi:CDP-glucose 4,6-dehydratase
MHFLITGHTGFKGAWLTLLLKERGHIVSGFSDKAEPSSLYETARLSDFLEIDLRGDVRNLEHLENAHSELHPDFVIHLAAQSLVKKSYLEPIATFETNVLGTLNVLHSSQMSKDLKGQLIITTDKVYRNTGKTEGYIESDPLGGHDPYSASKAMADIATQSWISSFENVPTAIARAGNVIGGGDVCIDRLFPDLINSYISSKTPKLRYPNSIRPWQHVLDCLNGYLILVDRIIHNQADGAWNFGPNESEPRSVADVANIVSGIWGVEKGWITDLGNHPHEAPALILNSNKARRELNWSDKLSFEESIRWTTSWFKKVNAGSDPLDETIKNIKEFELI